MHGYAVVNPFGFVVFDSISKASCELYIRKRPYEILSIRLVSSGQLSLIP